MGNSEHTKSIVDLESYKQGEPEALAAIIDQCGPLVWALARRGFVCEDAITLGAERTSIRVLGAPSAQVAAQLTERILASALRPEERTQAEDPISIEQHILELARRELFRAGERAARLISLNELEDQRSVPAEVEDLDALLYLSQRPTLKALPLDENTRKYIERGEQLTQTWVHSLAPESQSLIHLRFVKGRSQAAIAKQLKCGITAIALHEDRLRRRARLRLRVALNTPALGDADTEAFLAKTAHRLAASPVTWERLRKRVLRRTHRHPPASYSRRLAWGMGTLAVAALGVTSMWLGWWPSPSSATPEAPPHIFLRCTPACFAGSKGHISLRGPKNTRRFAVVLRSPSGNVEPLLVAPDGGSIRLPFGARKRVVPVPYPVRLPMDTPPGSEAVVVFSSDKLNRTEVLTIASGTDQHPYVTGTAATIAVP